VIDFLFTFPAIFFVDRWGRRIFLMAGALGMMVSHVVVAGIVGHYNGNFHKPGGGAAGWIGIVFIWVSTVPPIYFSRFKSRGQQLTRMSISSLVPTSHIHGALSPGSWQPRSSPPVTEAKQSALSFLATT
jgi:hypothetical protein